LEDFNYKSREEFCPGVANRRKGRKGRDKGKKGGELARMFKPPNF